MFTDPVKNLKQFGLMENMIVADLGAGTGFYSLAAAQMVPQGKVYAIEIQKDFLETLKNRAKDANLNNIDCFVGNAEKIGGTLLKDGIIDAIIASNVLFQIESKERFVAEVKRILKIGGRVLLIDWSEDSPTNTNLRKIVSEEEAQEIFENEGFILVKKIDAGAHHYGMILKKEK